MKLGLEEFRKFLEIMDIDAIYSTMKIKDYSSLSGIYYACEFECLGGDMFEFEYHTGYGFCLFNITGDGVKDARTWTPNQLKLWEALFDMNGSKLTIGLNTIDEQL